MSSTIMINLVIPAGQTTFNGTTFLGYLYTNSIFHQSFTFTITGPMNATTTNPITLTPALPPGNYILGLAIPSTATNGGTGNINATFIFNDIPPTTGTANLTNQNPTPNPPGVKGYYGDSTTQIIIRCIHGSSLIKMKDGTKRIDQIKENDEVLSGDNLDEYVRVRGVSKCWLTFLGVDHDAIIFEHGSLGNNEPYSQLIIDPGHPMCTRKEFLEEGYDALRPAGTYWEELKGERLEFGCGQILTKKWTDIFTQSEPSVRYDLILEEPYNIYVANEIVVRAKDYKDHRYKHFV